MDFALNLTVDATIPHSKTEPLNVTDITVYMSGPSLCQKKKEKEKKGTKDLG